MTFHEKPQSALDAALEYAARGWLVFPVPLGSKRSHKSAEHSGGRRWGATADPDEIRRDWQRWPDANVGICTGPESNLVVIDCDTAAAHGADGVAAMRALIAEHGDLPDTIEALSPSGSWHIYFRWPSGADIRNSAGLIAPGVDVRGIGGMILAPPSTRPGAGCYRWQNPPGLFDLADCPEWLIRLASKPEKPSESATPRPTGNASRWADAALRNEIAAVLAAPEGCRNETLNRAAFNLAQIVASGELDESDVVTRLTAAATAAGLEAGEIGATIRSGMTAGAKTPRGPKPKAAQPEAHTSDGEPRPNDDDDEIDLSHDALAIELGRRGFDENARHVAVWGRWLFWTGTRWEIDDRLAHLTQTRNFLRDRAREITALAERKALDDPQKADAIMKWAETEARALRNKNTVVAVETLARANAKSVAVPDDFDADRLLLGTPGGTVDLRTGEIRRPRREHMITKMTAVAPKHGTPKRWLQFLHEIFDGDEEIIAFMQRAAGYALTGETREHKLLFLYGAGRNGKSVFLNALVNIWGDYARRAHASTFLNSSGEKHPTDIAGLRGARLVVASELPKGKTWDEAIIKDLCGGDRMTARFMRQDFFDFEPQLTLMVAGNTQPSFRGIDEAIRARVVLVPFLVTIPPERRDKHLPDKLAQEAGEILSWAIEGAAEWQRRGLDVPASVAAASTEYLDGEDILAQFLADETIPDGASFVTTTALHQRFTQWCASQGLNVWTLRTLQKEIAGRGFQAIRRSAGAGFFGLRLR
jgi:P4 family phage/plasmid primase-like protien